MCERLPGLAYMLKQAWLVRVGRTSLQKQQTLNTVKAALERALLTKGSELQGISQSFLESSRMLLDYHRKHRPKAMAEGLPYYQCLQTRPGPSDFTLSEPDGMLQVQTEVTELPFVHGKELARAASHLLLSISWTGSTPVGPFPLRRLWGAYLEPGKGQAYHVEHHLSVWVAHQLLSITTGSCPVLPPPCSDTDLAGRWHCTKSSFASRSSAAYVSVCSTLRSSPVFLWLPQAHHKSSV